MKHEWTVFLIYSTGNETCSELKYLLTKTMFVTPIKLRITYFTHYAHVL